MLCRLRPAGIGPNDYLPGTGREIPSMSRELFDPATLPARLYIVVGGGSGVGVVPV